MLCQSQYLTTQTILTTHLDVVLFPGRLPEAQGRDAGEEAAEEGAAEGGAAEAVGILADKTGAAPQTKTTST